MVLNQKPIGFYMPYVVDMFLLDFMSRSKSIEAD